MIQIDGKHGTIFVFDEKSPGGSDLVIVKNDAGYLEVAVSDLATFYVEFGKLYDNHPVQVNDKASSYIRKAVEAGLEHQKAINEKLKAEIVDFKEEIEMLSKLIANPKSSDEVHYELGRVDERMAHAIAIQGVEQQLQFSLDKVQKLNEKLWKCKEEE